MLSANRISIYLAALLGSFLISSTASATYKCINPEGVIEYVELAKEGYECSELRTIPAPSPAGEEEADASENESDESADDPQAELRKANCQLSRDNLAALQSEGDVTVKDAEGNDTVLNEEQRAARLVQTEKDIAYWCDA